MLQGTVVPNGAFVITVKSVLGPETIERYNMFRSATVNGNAATGYSSGQAIAAMEATANSDLPDGYTYEWTGKWRLLSSFEAANGLLMFGWSTALIFAAVQWVYAGRKYGGRP